jgi:hypothetical protein
MAAPAKSLVVACANCGAKNRVQFDAALEKAAQYAGNAKLLFPLRRQSR